MFDNITDFFDEYVKKALLLQNDDNHIKEENTDETNKNYDNQNEENNIIENNITQIYHIINTNTEEDDTQQDDNINSQENIDFISELVIMNNKI